jgi:hypothetical protein
MSKRILMLGQVTTLAELEKLTFEFEAVLKEHGLGIKQGTDLERVSLAVLDLLGKHLKPVLQDPLQNIRPYFGDVLGLWTFMTKIVRHKNHPDFQQIVPHLALLNKGQVAQNRRTPISDDACNKLFELLVALICMDIGTSVRMDDPDESKGENPDVLCTIGERTWGFACKVPFRDTPKSLFDNLKKGIDQIEVSPAETGAVFFNYRNLIDHNGAWPVMNEDDVKNGKEPVFGCHRNPMALAADIRNLVTQQQVAMDEAVGVANVAATVIGKKTIPAFLVFGQTATGVVSPRGPIPTLVGTLSVCPYLEIDEEVGVLAKLNDAFHEYPGGRGPGIVVHGDGYGD